MRFFPEGTQFPICTQEGMLQVYFCDDPYVVANLHESENGCRKAAVLWGVCGEEYPLSKVMAFAKSLERAATLADIWVDTGMAVTVDEVLERYYPGRFAEETFFEVDEGGVEPRQRTRSGI